MLDSSVFSDIQKNSVSAWRNSSLIPDGTLCVSLDLEKEMRFTLSAPNYLRMDEWEMTLADGQRACVPAIPMIDQLERSNLVVPVRQRDDFGCPKELAFPKLEVTYRMKFIMDFSKEERVVELVMEPGTFLGKWEILINGYPVREVDFNPREVYALSNLAVDVTDLLDSGENEISVRVKTDLSYGGMRNPLYLAGNFAVRRRKGVWHLESMPQTMRLKDPVGSGLPFYSGEIVLQSEVVVEKKDWSEVYILADADWLEDSLRLNVEEYDTDPAAWKPYLFRIPSQYIKTGKCSVMIKIRNTALPLFEGMRFDREQHAYVKV